jgi:hypothetical protein
MFSGIWSRRLQLLSVKEEEQEEEQEEEEYEEELGHKILYLYLVSVVNFEIFFGQMKTY